MTTADATGRSPGDHELEAAIMRRIGQRPATVREVIVWTLNRYEVSEKNVRDAMQRLTLEGRILAEDGVWRVEL